MKIKYRLLPVEPYEVSALETWLSDLSAQGLYSLEIKTIYASFWVKEAKRMIYRMEPKKYRKEDFPTQDKLRLYKEYGWKYVMTFGEYFHIYTAEEGTPEIHTDPIVESELYHVFLPKKNYVLYLDIAFWVFLLALYVFDPVTLGTYQLVHSEYFFALAMPCVCILEIFISSHRICGLWRVYKQLALGIPFSHDSNWRGKVRLRHFGYFLCKALALIFYFLPFWNPAEYTERPMEKIHSPLPFVSLAEIEDDPNFVPDSSYIQHDKRPDETTINSWERDAKVVYFESSIGAPVQFSINQHGRTASRTDENGKPYEATLWLDYKKFSFLVSPQSYMEECIVRSRYTSENGWTKTILGDTPFDYALLLQKDDRSIFYMILGNKMLEADYIGGQDLTQCCDLFLEVLQKDYHR